MIAAAVQETALALLRGRVLAAEGYRVLFVATAHRGAHALIRDGEIALEGDAFDVARAFVAEVGTEKALDAAAGRRMARAG
jgi:hypothetical protein